MTVGGPVGLETLVEFTHRLRSAGIPVAAGTAGQMVGALDLVGLACAEDVYFSLRGLACISHEQLVIFDRVFADFFKARAPSTLAMVNPRARTWSVNSREEGEGDGERASPLTAASGASALERLRHRDFGTLTPVEEAQIRALIASMLWSPALARSRRRRPVRDGDRPDLRRTLRKAVGPEADMLRLEYTGRRLRRRPLIFIADVSGSMERYAEMLLYFAHSARGRLGRLEAFVFSTHLTRITRQLQRREPASAISEVAQAVTDWSSGTRIGEAIATFNRDWSRRLGRGGPIALIVSDGWDRGDPELLSREMARLRRSVHRVMWLNPIAGQVGFLPLTRGMKAALPHVDDFLPVTNLSNLEAVVRVLESVSAHRRGPVELPVKKALNIEE